MFTSFENASIPICRGQCGIEQEFGGYVSGSMRSRSRFSLLSLDVVLQNGDGLDMFPGIAVPRELTQNWSNLLDVLISLSL